MRAGLLFAAGIAAAAAHPRRHQHPAKRQAAEVEVVTIIDTVTATEPNVIVYVDGNGQPVSTSFYGAPATTPTDAPAPSSVAPSSYAEPTTESSSEAPPPPAEYSSSDSTPPPAPSSYAPPETPSSSAPEPSSSPDSGADYSGYTLSYSPYNSDGTCKSQDQVNSDFGIISGYSMVRTYGTDCNQADTVLAAAKAKGMKLFAGVFDVNNVNAEVQKIIDAASGDWSHVDTVAIGNEGVNNGAYSVEQVVQAIGTARGMLHDAGYNGKVVTVDTFVAMIANPQLCEASDYAAANCHPFFDGGVTAEEAGDFVLDQMQRVSDACGGKDTMITETGWPSGGDVNGKAVPSQENQVAAVNSIRTAFSSNIVLFSAFNDRWKQNNAGTFGAEHYWGIYGDSES
ncbi:Cell surface mannoprotein mp65 [Elasticomyces elasticus]|nr:Cell surface mannoprotein mp65 [Elasticomyces elasticus]KAK4924554.1 Cell surface mannoprotein mp65 [Elasticomyces elasticus]KAK5715691.1 Cell surface mannoprotein mp65 [Elasticomyces elasticus]KAK5761753.1 Cell surface mannoprotein mp65 [Elasticomyces elasticus]